MNDDKDANAVRVRPLTETQRKLVDFMKDFRRNNDYWPSRAEMSSYMNYASVNAIEDMIKALIKKGVIEITPGRARAIKIKETV